LLGVPVVGYDWCDEFPSEEFHPRGVWSPKGTEIEDGIHGDRWRCKAVKLFGKHLMLSDPGLIDLLIVCRRRREDAVESMVRLDESGTEGEPVGRDVIERAYDANYEMIEAWRKEHLPYDMDVHYESMITYPEVQVDVIAHFVGSEVDRQPAIDNVIRR
jgi:hypothetical protein